MKSEIEDDGFITVHPKLTPDRSHGSPYDRGRADSYYHRQIRPHKWLDGIGRVEIVELSPEEIAEYHAGYEENEDAGEFKEW